MTYPKNDEIKASLPRFFWFIFIVVTVVIWFFFINYNIRGQYCFPYGKFLSIFGLNIDIFGVFIASRKTKFFGFFGNGGDVERKRQEKESRALFIGLVLIGIGFFLQALGAAL